ncbi:MAG TPA: NfeD family protein [Cycloclasticus sp.]|jgi:membrane protein implicated in regulation of membrane protease activity|nr:NfeD family protein [Cycloclasticus sp.]HIL93584.1 NfeD family protein [Cycloclasticus sp.]
MEIEYWHWLVLGMLLIGFEIFIPSFTVLWFGLGALIVAGVVAFSSDLAMSWQLFIWAVLSTLFAIAWFKVLRPKMTDRTKAGIAREAIAGEVGMVIKAPSDGVRGRVRFTTPILGDDEWTFICEEPVITGDKVQIKEASGNALVVTKVS